MFYKVIYNDKIIDALDGLAYLKYQEEYDRMIFCEESEAQAILSSDCKKIWHVDGLYDIPVSRYETVRLEEIDEYDYKCFKVFGLDSMEDVIDNVVKNIIIDKNASLLFDSLKRLYMRKEINEENVIELCESYKIAEDIKLNILNVVI